MAKKTKKKANGKSAGKSGGKKNGKSKKGKGAKKQDLGPKPFKGGKGTSVGEVAHDFVRMFNARSPDEEIWKKWFSKKIVSIEGGQGMVWDGMKAVHAKSQWFLDNNTVHSCTAEGPYVGATGFGVKFTADIEEKASGNRATVEEFGYYTVKGGKVVQEEFMPAMPAGSPGEATAM